VEVTIEWSSGGLKLCNHTIALADGYLGGRSGRDSGVSVAPSKAQRTIPLTRVLALQPTVQIVVLREHNDAELQRFVVVEDHLIAETYPLISVELPREAAPPLVRGREANRLQTAITAGGCISEYPELLTTRREGDTDRGIAV
jgi:hypothetical protein